MNDTERQKHSADQNRKQHGKQKQPSVCLFICIKMKEVKKKKKKGKMSVCM